MFFLPQLSHQYILHVGEFLFGISNLVIAAGRDDDAAGGILGIGAEFDQTVGEPPHRAKHHDGNRDGREVRDDRRHDEGDRQKPERIGAHRLDQRRLVHGYRDPFAAHRRFADDRDDPSWRRHQRCHRLGQEPGSRLAKIVNFIHAVRQLGRGEDSLRAILP